MSVLTDARGTTVMEFGLVAPILCAMMMGLFDFGHTLYMQAVLQGTVQKAARDSTLQTSNDPTSQAALDQKVINQVLLLNHSATVSPPTRRYYKSFSAAASHTPEPLTDTNHNGKCDPAVGATPAETFIDTNGNGVWDADGGNSGGGAKDIIVYTVTMSYSRMFPIDKLIGGSGTTTLTATTVLANQPYGDQAGLPSSPPTLPCT